MVLNLVVQRDRNLLDGVFLSFGEVSGLFHLGNNEIPANQGFIKIQRRIVPGRFVDHSHQCGTLLYCQVNRVLAEKGL